MHVVLYFVRNTATATLALLAPHHVTGNAVRSKVEVIRGEMEGNEKQ